jgi:uncharacterized glyoxalase superfamily metalloenzyme YdcJ
MTFSKTPLQHPVSSALDLTELLLRCQTQGLTTNSRNSLSPSSARSSSRENLLSTLERAIADLDEEDDEDCAEVSIDTIDWGRSSHHHNYTYESDSDSEQ